MARCNPVLSDKVTIPVDLLGCIRGGSDAGRFVEVVEDHRAQSFQVFSYADPERSGEILDGVFVSRESLEGYFASSGWDVEWLPDA